MTLFLTRTPWLVFLTVGVLLALVPFGGLAGGDDLPTVVPAPADLVLLQHSRVNDKLDTLVDFKGLPRDPKMTLSEAMEFLQDRYDLKIHFDDSAFQKVNPKAKPAGRLVVGRAEIPKMPSAPLRVVVEAVLGRTSSPVSYRVCGDRIVIIPAKYADLQELFDDKNLKPRVTREVIRQSLRGALESLSAETGFYFALDRRVVEQAEKAQVKANFNDVPLDEAVASLADMAGLQPVILQRVIYVTSKANAADLNQAQVRLRKERLEKAKAEAEANLVVNGSFEQGPAVDDYKPLDKGSDDIMGWTVTRGQIDFIGSYWNAADREHSVDLHGSPGKGGVMQTLKTIKGQKYRATFSLAGTIPSGKVGVVVKAGDQEETFRVSGERDPIQNPMWVLKTWEFTAKDSMTVLEFYTEGLGDTYRGPALDNVSVVALSQ